MEAGNRLNSAAILSDHNRLEVVRRVVRRRLARWGHLSARDIANAVYTLLGECILHDDFKRMNELRPAESEYERIHRLLDNRARHSVRPEFIELGERRKQRVREGDLSQTPDKRCTSDLPGDQEQLHMALEQAFVTILNARERAVIYCRFYEGMSIIATARWLNCTEYRVRQTSENALLKLKDALADYD